MKDLLKGFREWSIVGKVEKFESKRKEYVDLLEQIIRVLDELSDLERLISICRGKIPEESEANINDVRSLFQVLENHSCLRIDRLGILKEILIEFDREDLLKEVDDFKKRRCDYEKEERRKGKSFLTVLTVSPLLLTKISDTLMSQWSRYIITSLVETIIRQSADFCITISCLIIRLNFA